MRFTSVVLACSVAASAAAFPTFPNMPSLVSAANGPDTCHCDVSKLSQPPSALPPSSSGLKLAMVAIGRGTQNYTCPTTQNSTAVPTSVGALAKLFDFSCVAARTNNAQMGNLTAGIESLDRNDRILTALPSTGLHYFNGATPTFALNNALGTVGTKKLNQTNAPSSAKNAVPWLKLAALTGQTSPVQEVYRLETADGAAPATCAGKTGAFTVEYAAEYWFYVPSSFSWSSS